MRLLFVLLLLCAPLLSYGYTIVSPSSQHQVIPLAAPQASEVFYGTLESFPHTFEFEIASQTPFLASIDARSSKVSSYDVSIIVIKEEERGVSEVGRTFTKEQTWEEVKDVSLAETFAVGGSIQSELQPGVYRIEVSSPNNDASYRLTLNGVPEQSYFSSLKELFAVKKAYKESSLGVVFSPLVYVPALLILMGFLFIAVRLRLVERVLKSI